MAPRFHQLALLILGAGIAICCAPVEPTQPSNILILLIDDFGVDMVGAYEEGTEPPPTPNIDRLASRGVLFRNAWSYPNCSPTRAAIHTGRYAFRTGIGTLVRPWGYALPLRELTIPEMLTLGTKGLFSTAAIGKWHLGNESVGGPHAPNQAGYHHFAGTL
ncbi:MAG: sulfatase-like hydrolase/transferase, partial [Myxococcota bacterium]